MQSIASSFKTLASRVAQAVARPSAARRASESEESLRVNLHSPDRKAVGTRGTQAAGKAVIQQLEKALTDNLIAMLCDPTTETVDASGICKAFEKDIPRGTDVIDQVATPARALQVGLQAKKNPLRNTCRILEGIASQTTPPSWRHSPKSRIRGPLPQS